MCDSDNFDADDGGITTTGFLGICTGTDFVSGNITYTTTYPWTGVTNEALMAKINQVSARISTIEQTLLKLFTLILDKIPDKDDIEKG